MVPHGRNCGALLRSVLAGMAVAWATVALPVAPVSAQDGFRLLEIGGSLVKWGAPVLGTAAGATYALVDRTTTFTDARNCGRMGPLESVLAAADMSPDQFQAELAAAFAMWESVAAVKFRRVDDPAEADILIGAQADIVRWSWAMADVALDDDSSGRVRKVARGLICLNPERPWSRGAATGGGMSGLRYALAHEIGHTIGLDHPGPTGALMAFRFDVQAPGLQAGDVEGVVSLYGVAQPPPLADLGRGAEVTRIR